MLLLSAGQIRQNGGFRKTHIHICIYWCCAQLSSKGVRPNAFLSVILVLQQKSTVITQPLGANILETRQGPTDICAVVFRNAFSELTCAQFCSEMLS